MTAYTVKLKRSANAGGIPTTSDLALGELAVNTTDGKLFTKKSVNGTESIVTLGGSVWDASGTNIFATGKDLGLGVTSPLSVVHIKDEEARILFHNDNTGTNATNGLLLGLGASHDATAYLMQQNNDHLHIGTNNLTRIYVENDGSIGIGTTSPSSYSYSDLVVAGSSGGMSIVTGNTDTGHIVFADGIAGVGAYRGAIQYDHANDRLEFAAEGSARAYLQSTGLGIGTSTPAYELDIQAAGNSRIQVKNTSVTGYSQFHHDGNGDLNIINTVSTRNLRWHNAGNERMRIDSSGRLLVGYTSIFANANADDFQLGSTSTATVGLTIGSSTEAQIAFGDAGDSRAGLIHYQHTDNSMRFYTAGPGNERVRIDSSGNVGVGTQSPSSIFTVQTSAGKFEVQESGSASVNVGTFTGTQAMRLVGAGAIQFSSTTSGEHARIDNSGRLLVGTSTSSTTGNAHSDFQIEGTDPGASISITRHANTVAGPSISFGKSRGTSNGSVDILNDDDQIGRIAFCGADGSDISTSGATIAAFVDGTPGANDMPGRLVFSTTADGASSTTERMRIDSSGNIGVGTISPDSKLHVVDSNSNGIRIGYLSGTSNLNLYDADEHAFRGRGSNDKLRIDSSGRMLVGMTSALASTTTALVQSNSQVIAPQGVSTNNGGWSMLSTTRVTLTAASGGITGHTVEIDLAGLNGTNHATLLRVSFAMRRSNTSAAFSQKSEYMGLWDVTKISTGEHIDATHIVTRELTVTSITYASNVVTLTFNTDNVRSFTARAFEYCTTGSLYTAAT